MKNVLVTGANGQLGKCLKDASEQYENMTFLFAERDVLNVDEPASVKALFEKHNFDYCINAAAYTNVEKAENDQEQAFLTNSEGTKVLAEICQAKGTVLIHISTDYVFDGTKGSPYDENDKVNPINVYGASKLKGETYIQELCEPHFIIRTSWLYSQYGHNFMNSMLRFAEERDELTITTEQTGVPTNANDLALAILKIVSLESQAYGVYHFSNKGEATWYDFAAAIFEYTGLSNKVKLGKTDYYRTFAKRPVYSILNTNKIEDNLSVVTRDWKESLHTLLNTRTNNS